MTGAGDKERRTEGRRDAGAGMVSAALRGTALRGTALRRAGPSAARMRGAGMVSAASRGTGLRGGWADEGSATVWALAVGVVIVAVAVASATVGAAIVARHRAQTAADLGALAGAGRAIEGEPAACARAEVVVADNGGRLVSCRLDGFDLTVIATVTPNGMAAVAGPARATATAGPVPSESTME